jgi:hypothetical protein
MSTSARLPRLPGAQDRAQTGFYAETILQDMEFSHTPPTNTAAWFLLLTKSEVRPCPALRRQSAGVLKGGRGSQEPFESPQQNEWPR